MEALEEVEVMEVTLEDREFFNAIQTIVSKKHTRMERREKEDVRGIVGKVGMEELVDKVGLVEVLICLALTQKLVLMVQMVAQWEV